jgi:hypothetical protein
MEEKYPWQCHECHKPFKMEDVTGDPSKPKFAMDGYVYCKRCGMPHGFECSNGNRTLPYPNPWGENAVRILEGD